MLQKLPQRIKEWVVKRFFAAHAFCAIIILLLITLFLFREAVGFFPGANQASRDHRISGMEFADRLHSIAAEGMALVRWIHHIQSLESEAAARNGTTPDTRNLHAWRQQAEALERPFLEVRAIAIEFGDASMVRRQRLATSDFPLHQRGYVADLALQEAQTARNQWDTLRVNLPSDFRRMAETLPSVSTESGREARTQLTGMLRLAARDVAAWDRHLQEWNPHEPVRWWQSAGMFFTGREWVTNSFHRDLYGVLPLLSGSLLVSVVALFFAIPFGVGSALYVNLLAAHRERMWMLPAFQAIAAIPSVILGFFGIVFLGEAVRTLSTMEWAQWIPGLPAAERMNAFTAGILLAVMAVPTIFVFSSRALQSVPRASVAASYAIGATRLQTILKVILPSAAPGMLAAVLIAFGRVVGETMIVLLCAGNRVMIPDFTEGLGAAFQPVHTLTGIVAQEMGEVAQGSLHYRSLFLIGVFLFLFCLLVHYLAQRLLHQARNVS